MAATVGILNIEIRGSTVKLSGDLADVGKAINKMGKGLEKTGKKLSKSITAPISLAVTAAAGAAIQFESAFAGVAKTVDGAGDATGELAKGIRNLSKEVPASAVAIANVAEAAGQLGVKKDDVLEFSRLMIGVGEATNLSADEAATSFAKLANLMGTPISETERLASALVALGNDGASTEADIAAMSLRLAAAGKTAGLTSAQVLGFSSALANVGIEAEMGGSAFSKIIKDMMVAVEKGGQDLDNFSKVAGMSASNFAKLFKEDASEALLTFIEGFGKVKEQGGSMIQTLDALGLSEIRVSDTALRAANAQGLFRSNVELATKAFGENTALAAEVSKRYATTASQIAILRNYAMDLAITFGADMLPAIRGIIDVLKGMITSWGQVDETTRKFIVTAALCAAAIGPLLLSIGTVATLLGGPFVAGISLVTIAISGLAAGFALYGGEIIASVKNWTETSSTYIQAFKEEFPLLNTAVTGYVDALKFVFKELSTSISTSFDEAMVTIQRFIKGVGFAFDAIAKINPSVAVVATALHSASEAFDKVKERAHALQEQHAALRESTTKLAEEVGKSAKSFDLFGAQAYDAGVAAHSTGMSMADLGAAAKSTTAKLPGVSSGLTDTGSAGKKAASELDKATDSLRKFQEQTKEGIISENLSKALENLNKSDFDKYLTQLADATRKGVIDGYKDASPAVQKIGAQEAEAKAAEEIRIHTKEYAEAVKKSDEERYENLRQHETDLAEEKKKLDQDAVDFYRNAMENAITGATFDAADSFKQLAIGFGAQLTASLLGGVGAGINSLKDLGGNIAKGIADAISGSSSGGSGILDAIKGAFGFGAPELGPGTGWTDTLSGLGLGPESATGIGGALTAAEPVAGGLALANALSEMSQIGQNTQETIEGISTGVGTAVGAYFGGPFGAAAGSALGNVVGDTLGGIFAEHKDRDTRDRDEFLRIINLDLGRNIPGGIQQFDSSGNVSDQNLTGMSNNIDFSGDWATDFWGKFGQEGGSAFIALGEAFANFQGLAAEVGPQIGAILAENLGGNIDNARLLMQGLGLSFEELEEAYIKAGVAAGKSWHEIEVGLQGLQQLSGKGLVAVGDLRGAYDLLIQSGGKGVTAIEAVRSIAIEAMEAGATTLQDLENQLRASGQFTEAEITQLMTALSQRGITSLEQLADASVRELGGIVADMESLGTAFDSVADVAGEASESVTNFNEQLQDIPDEIHTTIVVDYDIQDPPENAPELPQGSTERRRFAVGGVFNKAGMFGFGGSGLGMLGEKGPEGILPLTRTSKGLGVSVAGIGAAQRGVTIYQDLRGAAKGVGEEVKRAINEMGKFAVNASIRQFVALDRRGAF